MQQQELGIQFGKYQIYAKLAVGGMAELFLAKQPGIGNYNRTVVLKCILPHLATEEQFVTMFLDEARVVSQLNHPHICQIFEIGQVDNIYYIAMEYIRGQSFKALRKKFYSQPKLLASPYDMAAAAMHQVAVALHYAHTAVNDQGQPLNIVHRDVSPSNLLITYKGIVKLVDFGVAKASIQVHKTRAGMIKGKYRYMSPEQLLGGPIDHRSDIFSFGTVLYELSTNTSLFRRPSEVETIQAIHQDPILPPSSFDPHYPPQLERIVMHALERDREKRYQTMDEIRSDLENFLQTQARLRTSHDLGRLLSKLFAEEEKLDRTGAIRKPLSKSDIQRLNVDQDATVATVFSPPTKHPSGPPPTSNFSTSPPPHQENSFSLRGDSSHSFSTSSSYGASPHSSPPSSLPHHPSAPPPYPPTYQEPSASYQFYPQAPVNSSGKGLTLLIIFLSTILLLGGAYLFWQHQIKHTVQKNPNKENLHFYIRKIKSAIKSKDYIKASSLLEEFKKLKGARNHRFWIKHTQQYLRIAPQYDMAERFYREGDYLASRKILKTLLINYPSSERVRLLMHKVNDKLKRSSSSPQK